MVEERRYIPVTRVGYDALRSAIEKAYPGNDYYGSKIIPEWDELWMKLIS